MSDRLQGKTALITGASRGIGKAIALAYAAQGAHLVLSASRVENLVDTAQQAQAAGAKVECVAADLNDTAGLGQLMEHAIAWRGALDILVNNAGIFIGGKAFTAYSMEEFDQIMKVNVYAVFVLMQHALRHMQSVHGGKIVNIASTAGKWESPNQAAYNTSKHAVVGMTRCAALENAAAGINVNAICPGLVETDMLRTLETQAGAQGMSADELRAAVIARIPIGRLLKPQEIAHIAVYLGSSEADGMTGQTITISGGMRMG